jgi:signal transduction histidine kinase
LRTNTRAYAGLICVAQDLSDRRRLEAEVRQAQKLQAIGRLASGVAHEINTPVQFVSDSVHFARDAAANLASIIDKYRAGARALEGGVASEEAFAEAHDLEKKSDLPYLLERLPSALERATQGLDRIAAIVRSMKVFAHPGQAQMVPVDLNEAVKSTLTVAQSEYKYVADLETDFGELPFVTCHSGEINQAVLNLVVNAAHAIADNSSAETKGRITVRTRRDGDSVVVSVSDTGVGIPAEIRDQIFDPFFTTKDVGKGTGQGLGVARSVVVEKHRGQLTFETERGKGTTFYIRLPIRGDQVAPVLAPTATAAA